MTAYLFCPSYFFNIDKINIDKKNNNLYIAVDSGLLTAEKFGIIPQIIMGDMDSVEKKLLDGKKYKNTEKKYFDPVKNETDTLIAIKYAIEKKADNIIIIGGVDGRIDHTLVNLFYLKYLYKNKITGVITNGYNTIRYLHNDKITIKKNYKYISIIPIMEKISGLYLEGFKYPLENAFVDMCEIYSVSNEMSQDKEEAYIRIDSGEALICECDDIKI